MVNVDVSISTDFILFVFIVSLMLLSLLIHIRSKGYFKASISVTGVCLIIIGTIFGEMVKDGLLFSTVLILKILSGIFILVGLLLVFLGIRYLFPTNEEKT